MWRIGDSVALDVFGLLTLPQMTISQLMNPYLQWTIPKYMQVYDYLLFRSHYARCLVNGNYTVKLHFAEDLITQVHKQ